MDSQVLFTKNDNGTIEPVLALNASTILTTTKNLSQLSDVDTTGVSAQKCLIYNDITQKWEAILPSFSKLGDVAIDTGTLSASNVIKWSPAPVSKWVNRDLGYAVLNISGQIKDSVINTNTTEWSVLDPSNYETGTFSITSFVNNSISVDTTTLFQVQGLVNGGNYRIEWNFNYNILTPPSSGQALLTLFIKNQVNGTIISSQNQIRPEMKTLTASLSGVNNSSTASRFSISKSTLGGGLPFTGLTPLNVNIVISVIEM